MGRAVPLLPAPAFGRVAAAWRALACAVAKAWTAWSTARELASLSDHQLRDIGLSREDIPHAAREGRDYSFFSR